MLLNIRLAHLLDFVQCSGGFVVLISCARDFLMFVVSLDRDDGIMGVVLSHHPSK